MSVLRLSVGGVSFRHRLCVTGHGPGIRVVTLGFLLTATNFSILSWSLKMKRNDLHVQNRDIKEASSVFWSGGITRTQENYYTAWGKDLYYRHQSGICLMRGSIITIISRHEYTHAFMHVQMCVYCAYTSSPFILYASLIGSSHLFVNSLDKCFI
jgi:hypothetical protein